MENVDSLTQNFTLEDFVIIIGGSNDIKNNKTPSFRYICNKLKSCTNTNVLFSSIPFNKSHSRIKHVIKYNSKLHDFLHKLNKCTEGRIHYVDMNTGNGSKLSCNEFSNLLKKCISSNVITKNLIFVKIQDVNVSTLPGGQLNDQEIVPRGGDMNQSRDFLDSGPLGTIVLD